MKTTAIRNLTLGALFASFLGAAAFASAGDWHDRDYRHAVVVREYRPAVRVGFDFGVVIGAPVCAPPVIERNVVIRDRWDHDRWDHDHRFHEDRYRHYR